MKKNIKYLIILSFFVFISACSSSKKVTINTMRPAEITFPVSIQSIVILDRTEFSSDAESIIEGVLTGEMFDEDSYGTQELVNGFRNQMRYSDRFDIKVAAEKLKGNSLTSVFPNPLSWRVVGAFCEKYESEALLAVEIFDTDYIITDGVRKVKKKRKIDGKEREVEVNEYYAQGVANVTIGLRLYDPEAQVIVDQQLIRRDKTWDATGNSVRDAYKHLIQKKEATAYLSSRVGRNYAYKISPMPVKITRKFEGESDDTPEIEIGARYAEVGKWNEALDVWKNAISKAPIEDAGYLSYNIAVAYEVLGDIDSAIKWAETSYVKYDNDDALDYVHLLKERAIDEEQVRIQFEQPSS